MNERYVTLPLAQIEPDPNQPRHELESPDDPGLTEARTLQGLANSIREFGLLQPIRVRRLTEEKQSAHSGETCPEVRYRIVSGERRYEAAKKAGLTEVPTLIEDEDDTANTRLIKQVTENFQRKALTATELALAISSLLQTGASRNEVEKRLGVPASQITILLSLLNLSDAVKAAFARGRIESPRAAYDLNRLPSNVQEEIIAQAEHKGRVIAQKDVSDLRKEIAGQASVKKHRFEAPPLSPADQRALLMLLEDGMADPYDPESDRDQMFGEGWRALAAQEAPLPQKVTPGAVVSTLSAPPPSNPPAVMVPSVQLSHPQVMKLLDWLVSQGVVRGDELGELSQGMAPAPGVLGPRLAEWLSRI